MHRYTRNKMRMGTAKIKPKRRVRLGWLESLQLLLSRQHCACHHPSICHQPATLTTACVLPELQSSLFASQCGILTHHPTKPLRDRMFRTASISLPLCNRPEACIDGFHGDFVSIHENRQLPNTRQTQIHQPKPRRASNRITTVN